MKWMVVVGVSGCLTEMLWHIYYTSFVYDIMKKDNLAILRSSLKVTQFKDFIIAVMLFFIYF